MFTKQIQNTSKSAEQTFYLTTKNDTNHIMKSPRLEKLAPNWFAIKFGAAQKSVRFK